MDAASPVPRKTPGKMTTWIGHWAPGEKPTFIVDVSLVGATTKEIRAEILKLGTGKYDIVTGRTEEVEYKKVESDRVTL